MLANLKIENVAVIEKAEVNFTPGFNVLTGETGAGKSILIDSINAILGNRTSRELVRSGAQKACIWATFENIPQSVKKQLEKCGYEANDDLLLYREINAEGKGSCRVNGMPATAAVVRDISAGLLSIHGQHDSQSLTNPALHLGLLDQYAQNRDLFADYYRRYRELVTVKRQLDALNASEADKQRKIDVGGYDVTLLGKIACTANYIVSTGMYRCDICGGIIAVRHTERDDVTDGHRIGRADTFDSETAFDLTVDGSSAV